MHKIRKIKDPLKRYRQALILLKCAGFYCSYVPRRSLAWKTKNCFFCQGKTENSINIININYSVFHNKLFFYILFKENYKSFKGCLIEIFFF